MSQTIVLSNGDLVNIPAGANPIIFARIEETKLFLAAHPKPKRKPAKTARKASSGRPLRQAQERPSRRSQKAAMDSAVGWAMAETVRRVRSEIKPVRDDIPFDGEELTFASSADLWPEVDDYGLEPEI